MSYSDNTEMSGALLAEQRVIGALFMNAESISEICTRLKPNMFYSEILGAIYAEFVKGFEKNYTVNIAVVIERVDQRIPRDILQSEIAECVKDADTSALIKSYSEVVIRGYKARQISRLFQSTVISPAGIDEQISSLINDLETIKGTEETPAKSLAQITREYQDRYFREDGEPKIHLGLRRLDIFLGGLEGGDVIVIGARPAVGKSAFVTQIATNLSDQGVKVGFYSLEMQEKQMYERFLASESGIGVTRIRRAVGFIDDEEKRFKSANRRLERHEQLILSVGSKSVSEIRAESRHAGYDLIIIDYLQLLRPESNYRGNRTAEVGQISHSIKALAMELNIPIIVLSQMNRVSEIRDTKEPSMAELRESGDIEQDASVILLLWNMTKPDEDKGYRKITKKGCKIEKQRQGRTGKIIMEFDGDKMRFTETNEGFENDPIDYDEDDSPFK